MNPRKFKDHISPISKKTGESEADVKNIWGFYWEEMRKLLPQIPGLSVRVVGLGNFEIKYWLLDQKIKHTTNILNIKSIPRAGYETQLIRLNKLREEHLENVKRKKENKVKRKEYDS